MEWLNPEANNPEPTRRSCSLSTSSSPDVDRIGFRQDLDDALTVGLAKNLAVTVPKIMAAEGVKLNFVEQKNA